MIETDVLRSTLEHALRDGGDFAEVFVEDRRSSSARFDDGRVEELVSGPRPRRRASASCAATPPGSRTPPTSRRTGLLAAAEAAAGRGPRRRRRRRSVVALDAAGAPTAPADDDRAARDRREAPQGRPARAAPTPPRASEGGAITSVTASYADAHRRILVANSDGLLAEDDQVRTRLMVQCVATGDTGMQTGYEAPGRTIGFELFDDDRSRGRRPHRGAARAHAARRGAGAVRASCPVVLRRGAGGVLFHEACGHGLEADHIDKDASVFTGEIGEQVASPLVTLVDDGTYGREWGTLAIDDEGQPAQRNVLIENGVLTDYMWDLLRARKEGRAEQRQRPPRDLPAPADGAHDEHVPARRRRPIPTTSSAASTTASTACSSAAVRSTPRPATSCSASPRRT